MWITLPKSLYRRGAGFFHWYVGAAMRCLAIFGRQRSRYAGLPFSVAPCCCAALKMAFSITSRFNMGPPPQVMVKHHHL
jgi:hypothetical protein